MLQMSALHNMYEMIGRNPEVMDELVVSFLEETPVLIEQMQAAMQATSNDALGRAAHTLKSTARDFGAEHLASLCEIIETACRKESPQDAGTRIGAIAEALALSHAELAVYRRTISKNMEPTIGQQLED